MNATVAQLGERHASNVVVAGSMPVGRSISEAVVDALLEDDEVNDFLDRHADSINFDVVHTAMSRCGANWERIEFIDILPMKMGDHGKQFSSPEEASFYSVNVQAENRDRTSSDLYPVMDCHSLEQAKVIAGHIFGITGTIPVKFEGEDLPL